MLFHRAATHLGFDPDATAPAEEADFIAANVADVILVGNETALMTPTPSPPT